MKGNELDQGFRVVDREIFRIGKRRPIETSPDLLDNPNETRTVVIRIEL